MIITLDCAPPSVNHYWKVRCMKHPNGRYFPMVYVTPEAKAFKEMARSKYQGVCYDKETRFKVGIGLFFKGNRRKDIDNYSKCILDAYNKVIWPDDSQIIQLHIYKKEGCQEDKTIIKIEAIDNG